MNDLTGKLTETDRNCLWYPFTQMQSWLADEQVIIEKGDGFHLIDTDGRRYIDGFSSLWCNVHGHHVPKNRYHRDLRRRGIGQAFALEVGHRAVQRIGEWLRRSVAKQ